MGFSVSAAFASRTGHHAFSEGSDDRVVLDASRRLFVVADGSGPTYGGYYAPLGMDAGLSAIVDALAIGQHGPHAPHNRRALQGQQAEQPHVCDDTCLRTAFGAAQEIMQALNADYRSRRLRLQGQTLEVSLRACQEVARTRLGRTLSTFAHFDASISALHFTADSVVVAQIGTNRTYRWRRNTLELLLPEHTLEAETRAAGNLDALDRMDASTRLVCTRLLGATPAQSPAFRIERVEPGDRYVLCSDGAWSAWRHVDEKRLAREYASNDAHAIAQGLLHCAEASQPDLADDASVVAIVIT